MRRPSFTPTWLRRVVVAAAAVLGILAQAKEEKWLRVATPEFTLVTSLTEKEAVVWAAEFSQYVAELRSLFSFTRPLPPLTIVVFARERIFEDYRPLNAKGKPEEVAGFFLRHESWAVAGLAGRNAPDEVRRTIFHEGVHWFLSAFERQNPVWIEEGLAEVFSTFAVTKNKAEWGRAIPEHVALLNSERLLPMDKLLYVGQSELFLDDSTHTGIIYAQSWAAVHFLLYGQNKDIPRSALFDFLKLTHGGTSIEAAFRQAFHSDYATFDRRLGSYLAGGGYYVRNKPPVALAPLRAEPAPPVEVAQALGRLALAARRWEKATVFARNSIALVADDPRGYELLGMARQESGDAPGGLEAFRTAVDKGSRDFQPYFEIALAAQRAAANDADEVAELKPDDARRVADHYERAILLHPRFRYSYQNLAGIVGLAEPKPQDRDYLELGQKIYPTDGLIRIGLAVLTEQAGDRASARKVVDEIQDDSTQPGRVRAYARRLSDGWAQQEVTGHLDALAKEEKFSEALVYLEEQLSHASLALRTQLASMRPQLKAALRSQEIGSAFNEQRWEDARRLLTETIESPDMPIQLKRQAQRSLDDLNKSGVDRKRKKQ